MRVRFRVRARARVGVGVGAGARDRDRDSTTKNMEFILRSRHRVFQRNEEIPAINVVGLGSNSNCVVTSISTTERELHIQLEPIVSTAPCLLSNGHILSLELVQSECGQCLAPNPRSNQHVRIVSVWKGHFNFGRIAQSHIPRLKVTKVIYKWNRISVICSYLSQ